MAKNELGLTGEGVEALEIPELDKAISKYQKKKTARCEASPDEISAKKEVKVLLQKHRKDLPKNAEGVPFYKCDDRVYLLEDKLVVHKAEEDEEDEED